MDFQKCLRRNRPRADDEVVFQNENNCAACMCVMNMLTCSLTTFPQEFLYCALETQGISRNARNCIALQAGKMSSGVVTERSTYDGRRIDHAQKISISLIVVQGTSQDANEQNRLVHSLACSGLPQSR
jgi:hypothetical protein